jgi:hypothetical protein
VSGDRSSHSHARRGLQAGVAALALVCAVVLAVVRSRRTGLEVGLVAAALFAFGLRPSHGDRRRILTILGWAALVTVAVIGIEPHVH